MKTSCQPFPTIKVNDVMLWYNCDGHCYKVRPKLHNINLYLQRGIQKQKEIGSRSKDTGTVGATFILLNCSAPTILEIEEILRIYIFQSLSSVEAAMHHKDAG